MPCTLGYVFAQLILQAKRDEAAGLPTGGGAAEAPGPLAELTLSTHVPRAPAHARRHDAAPTPSACPAGAPPAKAAKEAADTSAGKSDQSGSSPQPLTFQAHKQAMLGQAAESLDEEQLEQLAWLIQNAHTLSGGASPEYEGLYKAAKAALEEQAAPRPPSTDAAHNTPPLYSPTPLSFLSLPTSSHTSPPPPPRPALVPIYVQLQ